MRSRLVLWGARSGDVQAGSREDRRLANPGDWISMDRIAEKYADLAGFRLEPWQARFVEAFQKGETPRLASPDEVEVARRRHDKEMLRAAVMVGER